MTKTNTDETQDFLNAWQTFALKVKPENVFDKDSVRLCTVFQRPDAPPCVENAHQTVPDFDDLERQLKNIVAQLAQNTFLVQHKAEIFVSLKAEFGRLVVSVNLGFQEQVCPNTVVETSNPERFLAWVKAVCRLQKEPENSPIWFLQIWLTGPDGKPMIPAMKRSPELRAPNVDAALQRLVMLWCPECLEEERKPLFMVMEKHVCAPDSDLWKRVFEPNPW